MSIFYWLSISQVLCKKKKYPKYIKFIIGEYLRVPKGIKTQKNRVTIWYKLGSDERASYKITWLAGKKNTLELDDKGKWS